MVANLLLLQSVLCHSASLPPCGQPSDKTQSPQPDLPPAFSVRILPAEMKNDEDEVILFLGPGGGISTLSGTPVHDERLRELLADLTKKQTKPLHIRLQVTSEKETSTDRLAGTL